MTEKKNRLKTGKHGRETRSLSEQGVEALT